MLIQRTFPDIFSSFARDQQLLRWTIPIHVSCILAASSVSKTGRTIFSIRVFRHLIIRNMQTNHFGCRLVFLTQSGAYPLLFCLSMLTCTVVSTPFQTFFSCWVQVSVTKPLYLFPATFCISVRLLKIPLPRYLSDMHHFPRFSLVRFVVFMTFHDVDAISHSVDMIMFPLPFDVARWTRPHALGSLFDDLELGRHCTLLGGYSGSILSELFCCYFSC